MTHLARAVAGIRYENRGEMRLKNLSDPVSVVRIVATDGDAMRQIRPFAARPPAPSGRSRTVSAVVAGAVALALVAISIPLVMSRGGETVPLDANSLTRLNPEDGSADLEFELDLLPNAMAIGFESAWIVESDHHRVVRLRLDDGSVAVLPPQAKRHSTAPQGVSPA